MAAEADRSMLGEMPDEIEDYPERFITADAVYTVRSVDFVPARASQTVSLFDDSEESIDQTWKRASAVSVSLSSATDDDLLKRADRAKGARHRRDAGSNGVSRHTGVAGEGNGPAFGA
jgi:hypothetical protein